MIIDLYFDNREDATIEIKDQTGEMEDILLSKILDICDFLFERVESEENNESSKDSF